MARTMGLLRGCRTEEPEVESVREAREATIEQENQVAEEGGDEGDNEADHNDIEAEKVM